MARFDKGWEYVAGLSNQSSAISTSVPVPMCTPWFLVIDWEEQATKSNTHFSTGENIHV